MSRRPTRLALGYKVLRVEWVKELGDAWGIYLSDESLIRIVAAQEPRARANTLLHELAHAIYDRFGLKPGDGEERVAHVMATGFSEIFARNPDLLTWLKKELASGN